MATELKNSSAEIVMAMSGSCVLQAEDGRSVDTEEVMDMRDAADSKRVASDPVASIDEGPFFAFEILEIDEDWLRFEACYRKLRTF